jgi:hypothetical protein
MLQVTEEHLSLSLDMEKGYHLGEPQSYRPFTEDRKRLFKAYQQEYGRCMSKVYQDGPDGVSCPVGWVFQKVREYEDARSKADRYIHEVWVTFREVKEEV